MCGILGYSGPQKAVPIILEGLTRLEYRGYDSAGICIDQDGQLKVYKCEGKLQVLKDAIQEINTDTHTAIGHTRWATHGAVNEINAHPHSNEDIAIVHNGIIENANELRNALKEDGYIFKSETDTEVFLHLLAKIVVSEKNRIKAIGKAFGQIKGNSAIVVMEKESSKLYAIKRGAPLVCGENATKGELFVSSDPYAIAGFAENMFFPEDEVICTGKYGRSGVEDAGFYELNGEVSNRFKIQEKNVVLEVVEKGEYEHFMLKEIFEQAFLIRRFIKKFTRKKGIDFLERLNKFQPDYIHIIACGTAWHAGLVIKSYLEKNLKIRVNCELASEFRYRNPIINNNELGLFISQSGETADTLACQELCKKAGIKTYSIVNVKGSTLYRNCEENMMINAGVEIGVASTKAFTLQCLTGYIFTQALVNKIDVNEQIKTFNLLADHVDDVLSLSTKIKSIARNIYNKKGFLFTGRGEQFPIALEGALKLKEIAYVHAEGYAAGELKHGPISLIDQEMVNIAIITPDLFDKTFSNAQEVKSRRGIMVVIGDKDNKELIEFSDYFIGLDFGGMKQLEPILTNIVMQLLSYHIAFLKGTDIDKPRNLAKSVTVE